MSVDRNPYYHPEAWGLTEIAQHDIDEPDYSFHLIVAWHGEGGVYLGTDSGCSCPAPFENYGSINDLTGPLTTDQALEEASSLKGESTYDLDGWNKFVAAIRASQSGGAA